MSERFQDMRPLFSGQVNGTYNDKRSDLFVSKLIQLQDVANGFGPADNNTVGIKNIYQARNYEERPTGMNDEEIHPEFIQFIKEVGQYHNALDSEAGANDAVEAARGAVVSFDAEDTNEIITAIRNAGITTGTALTSNEALNGRAGALNRSIAEGGILEDAVFNEILVKAQNVEGLNAAVKGRLIQDATNKGNNEANASQKALHAHIKARWNSMEQQFRVVYEVVMNVVDKNGRAMSISEFVKTNGDMRENRYNFKTIGGDEVRNVVFRNMVPEELVGAYDAGRAEPYTGASKTIFTFNLSKYLRSELARGVDADDRLSDIFARDEESCSMYGRRNGVLVRNTANGQVPVGQGSEYYNSQVTTGNKCMTTQFSGDCTSYVTKCLRGEDIDQCKEFFTSQDWWATTQEEIRNMNPEIAMKTLRAFGFKEVTTYNSEHKRNIVRVQEVHTWVEGLSSVTNDQATINAIASNTKLVQYLKWVVQLVNCNPAVLNSNFTGTVGGDGDYDPNRFSHTGLAKMGLVARRPVRDSCHKDIDSLASAINRYNITLGIRLNAPIVGGIIPVRPMVGGGSVVTLNEAETSVDILRESRKETSTILGKTFEYLVKKLQNYQKDISPGDSAKIEQLINDLAKKENKLYEIINFVEKYSMIVDVFGEDAGQKNCISC